MNKIKHIACQHWLFITLISGTCLGLLFWISQYTSIGFLQLHSIDEYVFHGSLRHMFLSAIAGNVAGVFGYGFYQYGFAYFFGNLLLSAPFIWLDNTAAAIAAPRLITATFAALSLVYLYRFALLSLTKTAATLVAAACVLMPAFWYNATWFHPDWPMTFFIIACAYHLARDNFQYRRHFWIGVICYSLAVMVKYQAITFLPLLGFYLLYTVPHEFSWTRLWQQLRRIAMSGVIIAGIFVAGNPYILHPLGWNAFSSAFTANMNSNATNHGSAASVSVSDKINDAIVAYYVNEGILLLLIIIAAGTVISYARKPAASILPIISLSFLLNLGYLLLFVNKAWQMYYLPTMMTGIMVGIAALAPLAKRYSILIMTTVVFLQIAMFGSNIIPTLTRSRDYSAADFPLSTAAEQTAMHDFILNSLTPHLHATSTVLLSAYTPFTYESLGLPYEQVRIIFGSLTTASFDEATYIESQRSYWGELKTDDELRASFIPIDFIIIRKDTPFFDTSRLTNVRDQDAYIAGRTIVNGLYHGTFDYTLLAENDLVVIFIKK